MDRQSELYYGLSDYEKADSKNLNHRSKESIQFIAETAGVDEETAIKVLLAE